MFVLIKCDTCRVGTSLEEVYEFDSEQSEILSINGVNMYNLLDESF